MGRALHRPRVRFVASSSQSARRSLHAESTGSVLMTRCSATGSVLPPLALRSIFLAVAWTVDKERRARAL